VHCSGRAFRDGFLFTASAPPWIFLDRNRILLLTIPPPSDAFVVRQRAAVKHISAASVLGDSPSFAWHLFSLCSGCLVHPVFPVPYPWTLKRDRRSQALLRVPLQRIPAVTSHQCHRVTVATQPPRVVFAALTRCPSESRFHPFYRVLNATSGLNSECPLCYPLFCYSLGLPARWASRPWSRIFCERNTVLIFGASGHCELPATTSVFPLHLRLFRSGSTPVPSRSTLRPPLFAGGTYVSACSVRHAIARNLVLVGQYSPIRFFYLLRVGALFLFRPLPRASYMSLVHRI